MLLMGSIGIVIFKCSFSAVLPENTSSGQKTHPYCDINILTSIVCVTMPLYFSSNEA